MIKKIGIIMNGVTGRMGTNQHLVRSILAIREQGGIQCGDVTIMPDPILTGRNAEKVKALAEKHGVERHTADLDAALALPKEDGSLEQFIKTKVLEMGENLQFSRFERLALDGEGAVASYIHLGGKVGVLIEVGAGNAATAQADGFKDLVKDLTLHIAATSPAGLKREDIPADLVESEKDIFRKQMEGQNKPADILEKIIEGKLGKFYSERCLLEQGFVKDPDTAVKALLEAKGKELGDTITINNFLRFGLGE